METDILRHMIAVIKAEEQRRRALLEDEDPNFAYDQWLFTDAPFVNELYLILLVSLRHQVERELVGLAARAADDGKEISGQQYQKRVRELRIGKRWDWQEINNRLKPESCEDTHPWRLFVFWLTRTSTIPQWSLTTTYLNCSN